MLSDGIAISYGYWTVCISDIRFDNYLYSHQSEFQVSSSRILPIEYPRILIISPVNGNHLAAETQFLEKRRRGLARFINALIQHPALKEEQLVTMFLTVPTVDVCPPPEMVYSLAN